MLPKRHSVRLLLQLITKSQSNTEALFSQETACQDLFAHELRHCGDFCVQVNLAEVHGAS